MNFNYSYRAFLITSLLFGCLLTILFGVKIKSKLLADESHTAIEVDAEIIEDVNLQQSTTEKTQVKTNKAYNEAEAFIQKIEDERTTSDTKNNQTEITDHIHIEPKELPKKNDTKKPKLKGENESKKPINNTSISAKTTIRYNLANRNAIELPNPAYICESGGTIVINIEVNDFGKVTKVAYNKNASTTTNGCLLDSALEYARASKFTSTPTKKKQLGSISYNFPGQKD